MGQKMHKKGDIELSKIVTFIIVVVVLIVIVAFFLGGTTSITKAIKNVFFGVTAGTDRSLAEENCRQYCEQAKSLQTIAAKQGSPYCTRYDKIDANNDGKADYTGAEDNWDRWYCSADHSKAIPNPSGAQERSLDIPCDLGVDSQGQRVTCVSSFIGPTQ